MVNFQSLHKREENDSQIPNDKASVLVIVELTVEAESKNLLN